MNTPIKVVEGIYLLEHYDFQTEDEAKVSLCLVFGDLFWRFRRYDEYGNTVDQDFPYEEFADLEDFKEYVTDYMIAKEEGRVFLVEIVLPA